MNKTLKMIGAGVASLLLAATTQAATFGDGGAALQAVLDGITTSPAGNSSINVTTDEVPDGQDSYWAIGGSGGSIATLIIELAGNAANNVFGLFDRSNPANKVIVANGAAVAGNQFLVSILLDGSVLVNFADTGIDFAGNNFGFYLDTTAGGQGVFYSDTGLNADGLDHMYAYQGTGDTIQIPPFAPGPWGANEYILAFEDLLGGGDKDYDDFVILVESVSPVPDGGMSLLMLGAGLLGLARFARRS